MKFIKEDQQQSTNELTQTNKQLQQKLSQSKAYEAKHQIEKQKNNENFGYTFLKTTIFFDLTNGGRKKKNSDKH